MRKVFGERKNQMVLGLLVVMVGTAGYLNYADSNASNVSTEQLLLNDEGEIISTLDQGVLAPTSELASTDETKVVEGEQSDDLSSAGDAAFVSSNSNGSFFIQAKLEREQARAKQKDVLVEVINNDNIKDEEKKEASDKILQIQDKIEKETSAEAMIEAKGFKEVYVRIDEETVDVIVSKENLSETELAQIEDIVKRKTGYDANQIRISAYKFDKE